MNHVTLKIGVMAAENYVEKIIFKNKKVHFKLYKYFTVLLFFLIIIFLSNKCSFVEHKRLLSKTKKFHIFKKFKIKIIQNLCDR